MALARVSGGSQLIKSAANCVEEVWCVLVRCALGVCGASCAAVAKPVCRQADSERTAKSQGGRTIGDAARPWQVLRTAAALGSSRMRDHDLEESGGGARIFTLLVTACNCNFMAPWWRLPPWLRLRRRSSGADRCGHGCSRRAPCSEQDESGHFLESVRPGSGHCLYLVYSLSKPLLFSVTLAPLVACCSS